MNSNQPDPAVEAQAQVQATLVAGVLRHQVQPQGGEVAVEDAGVVALVTGDGMVAVPIRGDAVEQGADQRLDTGEIHRLQTLHQGDALAEGALAIHPQGRQQGRVEAALHRSLRL